jgi:transposase
MKTKEIDERRQKFAALVATGLSTTKAAKAVGISVSTGFKWAQPMRAFPTKTPEKAVRFARLVPRDTVEKQMQVEIGGVVIKVDSTFDEGTLARLIRVVRGAL